MKTAKSAKAARASPRSRKPPRLRLAIQHATRSRTLPTGRQIARWARAALRGDAEVTVRIVDTAEGRALNRAYRGKDYATNVLTFILNETSPYRGDLVLTAPVVTKEAREQKKDVIAHYAHLTIHGVLHLQGYDHENALDAEEMEKLEQGILKRLGYPDPYSDHGPTQ